MSKTALRIIDIHRESLSKPLAERPDFISSQYADLFASLTPVTGAGFDPQDAARALDQEVVSLVFDPNFAAPSPANISARRK
jgi:hypothetical protein